MRREEARALVIQAQDAAARGDTAQAADLLGQAFAMLAPQGGVSINTVLARAYLLQAKAALEKGGPIGLPDHWDQLLGVPRPSPQPQQQDRRSRRHGKDRRPEPPQSTPRQEQPRPEQLRSRRKPMVERTLRDPRRRIRPEAARMLDLAESYMALGSYAQARRQVDRVRPLIAAMSPPDVLAGSLAQRLNLLDRYLAPPRSPRPSKMPPRSSTSVHTVPGGLPTLGRRR